MAVSSANVASPHPSPVGASEVHKLDKLGDNAALCGHLEFILHFEDMKKN
jgi:hypothetical protein